MGMNFPVYLFLFSTLMPVSYGEDSYQECSTPSSCGLVKDIRYPFLVANTKPAYCGVPQFMLNCDHQSDYPLIMSFWRLHSIDTYTHSIFLYLDKFQTCSALETFRGQNISQIAAKHKLKPGSNTDQLTLFLGCPDNITSKFDTATFPCHNHGLDTDISVYYFHNKTAGDGGKCESYVVFLVSKTALAEFVSNRGGVTIASVLETVYEVEYTYVDITACSECQNSGGVCSSSLESPSSNKLVCYHPVPSKKRHFRVLIGSVSSTVGICTFILVALCLKRGIKLQHHLLWKGKATTNNQNIEACLKTQGFLAPKRYTYADIRKMTKSFKHKLGKGGYAVVYKGELHDGRLVAVKLLKKSKGNDGEEFMNEVMSIGRTNHVNIVTLLGFCFDKNRSALIYEFMPNGSLDKFTHHGNNGCHHDQSLPKKTILNIAVGIAKGLEYLHRGCNTRILHFDIKPHNILLDDKFQPKISDFGLARLCTQNESTISTMEARGTIGYIAPEVFSRNFGGVSHKSDVYSYGMMVLDLVYDRQNISTCVEGSSELFISDWVYQRAEEFGDKIEEDGITMSDEERDMQKKMMLVSLWCIQTYPSSRPSISKVVEMLEGNVELIPMPPKPFLCSPPRLTSDSSIAPSNHTLAP